MRNFLTKWTNNHVRTAFFFHAFFPFITYANRGNYFVLRKGVVFLLLFIAGQQNRE